MPPELTPPPAAEAPLDLGDNDEYKDDILAASERTGIDPAALAAMIDAEAAKKDGVWDKDSKATGSSAAGLTQFLKGTWNQQAVKAGTYLNEKAVEQGLVEQTDDGFKIVKGKEQELLDLRNDARTSIITGAEYGKDNLDALDRAGLVPEGASDDEKAKLMYLAHHEGASGAKALLNGTLDDDRAKTLLEANVGETRAEKLTENETASEAYKTWLNSYIDRKIQPDKFRPETPAGPQ